MNIPIELISLVLLFAVFICWLVYNVFSRFILMKRYNPNEDKSRLGEEQRRTNIQPHPAGNLSLSRGGFIKGEGDVEGQRSIPTGFIKPNGKDSRSRGKASSRLGELLKRNRK